MYYQEKGRETMGKYENDVKRLLDLIGGKENIQAVSHCMTRMRFVLVDPKKAASSETMYPYSTMNLLHMPELRV